MFNVKVLSDNVYYMHPQSSIDGHSQLIPLIDISSNTQSTSFPVDTCTWSTASQLSVSQLICIKWKLFNSQPTVHWVSSDCQPRCWRVLIECWLHVNQEYWSTLDCWTLTVTHDPYYLKSSIHGFWTNPCFQHIVSNKQRLQRLISPAHCTTRIPFPLAQGQNLLAFGKQTRIFVLPYLYKHNFIYMYHVKSKLKSNCNN